MSVVKRRSPRKYNVNSTACAPRLSNSLTPSRGGRYKLHASANRVPLPLHPPRRAPRGGSNHSRCHIGVDIKEKQMENTRQPSWGPLEQRFGGTPRPRKLLALDGGGIRGVLTLQVLIRMEDVLREQSGQGEQFRLCNFFDYIGGTSTGAIIAAGLARGMSARELADFYLKTGPAMFDKSFILFRLRHLYESNPLKEKLQETFGAETTLFPEFLKCLLLVVTRNVST